MEELFGSIEESIHPRRLRKTALCKILRAAALARKLLQYLAKQAAHVPRKTFRLREGHVSARPAGEQCHHFALGHNQRREQAQIIGRSILYHSRDHASS